MLSSSSVQVGERNINVSEIIAIKTANITDKNGNLAGIVTVSGDEDIMVITDTGVIIRTAVANISQTGRVTQGVKVMRLDDTARIVTFALVEPEEID